MSVTDANGILPGPLVHQNVWSIVLTALASIEEYLLGWIQCGCSLKMLYGGIYQALFQKNIPQVILDARVARIE